jgi:UDP-N-acetylmuramate-alanine ligase
MTNLSPRHPDYFESPTNHNNNLSQYIQSLNPEIVTQLSQPSSQEVLRLIQRAIVEMLGNLPHDKYQSVITTSRDELGRLLGSAMVDGYFLRNVEQRLEMEKTLQLTGVTSAEPEQL